MINHRLHDRKFRFGEHCVYYLPRKAHIVKLKTLHTHTQRVSTIVSPYW